MTTKAMTMIIDNDDDDLFYTVVENVVVTAKDSLRGSD